MDHFLQSPAWANFQRALGRTVHQRSGPGWSFLAIEESNPAGKLLYAPYGPVAASLAAFDTALAALTDLARSCGAVLSASNRSTPASRPPTPMLSCASAASGPRRRTSSRNSPGSWTWTGISRTSWRA